MVGEVSAVGKVIHVCFECRGTGNIYEDYGNGYASATACGCESGRMWTEATLQLVGLSDGVPEGAVVFGEMPSEEGNMGSETGPRFVREKRRSPKLRGRF